VTDLATAMALLRRVSFRHTITMIERAAVATRALAALFKVPARHVLLALVLALALSFASALSKALSESTKPSTKSTESKHLTKSTKVPSTLVTLSFQMAKLSTIVAMLLFVGAVRLEVVLAAACIALLWAGALFRQMAHATAVVTFLQSCVWARRCLA